MWQRFTERARRIVFFAQQEASGRGENYVSMERLLLGMAREHDTVAARILETLSLPAETRVKFLKLVSGNLALVRVLEEEREGEALYVLWESFQLTGEDTAPWPPRE